MIATDDKLTPMEAEILDMPRQAPARVLPSNAYGTAAPQHPKRDHTLLWIVGGLLVIAVCTMSVVAAALQIRFVRNNAGSWMLTTKTSLEEAAPENYGPQNLELPAGSTVERATSSELTPDPELSLHRGTAGSKTEELKTIYNRALNSVVCLELSSYYGSRTVTGVVISEDGYLLTASDGLSTALAVTALLPDGTEQTAAVIGEDLLTGIAVLKIEAEGLTPAEFGDSGELSVGDQTLCIGNPYGTQMRGVLHEGIVAALGRETIEEQELSLLQSSADFGSGNYGCPVYDRAGRIVALTSPVGKRLTKDGSDPAFAVCAEDLERIVSELLQQHADASVWVGIEVEEIPLTYRKYFGYPGRLWVSGTAENSVASELLCLWDVIVEVDGTEVNTPEEFQAAVARHDPDDKVELTIYRGGRWYAATLPVSVK